MIFLGINGDYDVYKFNSRAVEYITSWLFLGNYAQFSHRTPTYRLAGTHWQYPTGEPLDSIKLGFISQFFLTWFYLLFGTQAIKNYIFLKNQFNFNYD